MTKIQLIGSVYFTCLKYQSVYKWRSIRNPSFQIICSTLSTRVLSNINSPDYSRKYRNFSSETEKPKTGIMAKFRETIKKYGYVALGVHISVFLSTFSGLFLAMRNGLDGDYYLHLCQEMIPYLKKNRK